MNSEHQSWMDTTPNDWCALDENDNLLDRDKSLVKLCQRQTRQRVVYVLNWFRPKQVVE